ncbi:MAG: sigma-70 family RNA polymerase sigma factor [Clostridium sp.]|jgi:RNA polymerase sigma factor (sigma-70 family)|uniref:sigma-70 family RNA polymerase sigma factor n=1 Tax=Clostridium sp. TaxID=1506 RepID=UPI0025C0956C|nr:sigma-70 family RNA polymerase sigma factor [Clostridium sp.]MCH3965032.1 sigma-70 family RNA polymerase sigma factor [Clostridium sp.]MCI1714253.1 sigma-70 family RNA polymerase sigma factor [Clostridium sp.]MCI1798515.1 sigma-70 family RNA polymerase sigma factor [Clostridium sp.]MCI1812754.1 sigma-70 family RNA polymerase sigma factor [Clostridium sp.]MCI1869324.1 sigma-70 family RNA polymerase sigma factor [Clostridium sp.]
MKDRIKLEKLVESAKNGDRRALEEICRSFEGFIVKKARTIYIRGYEMEDLIQEGYRSVITAVNRYDVGKNSFTAYVTNSIVKNFYSLMRKNLGKPFSCSLNSVNDGGCELMDTLVSGENIEEDFVTRENESELASSMDKLSRDEKDIIFWYYLEEKSLGEYAESRNVSYRTAVYRKKIALDKLKKIFLKN